MQAQDPEEGRLLLRRHPKIYYTLNVSITLGVSLFQGALFLLVAQRRGVRKAAVLGTADLDVKAEARRRSVNRRNGERIGIFVWIQAGLGDERRA